MFFPIFLVSASAALLCIIFAKAQKRLRPLLIPLSLLAAVPAVTAGLILCGLGSLVSYPGDPQEAADAFFSHISGFDYTEADRLLLGESRFDTDELSEDALAVTLVMSEQLQATPLGDPICEGAVITQPMLVTHMDTDALSNRLYDAAYAALSDMMVTCDAEALFTPDGSAYLPNVKSDAWELGVTAAAGAMSRRTVTERVDMRLLWTPFGYYVLPDHGLTEAVMGCGSLEEMDRLLSNIRGDVLEHLPLLRKIYVLDENVTTAPAPDADGFHSTTDPQEVVAVIEQAALLLDGQTVSWSPDIKLLPDSVIRYYLDDSILVIIWQEVLDNCVVTFSEIKIAHASQLFRTLCGGKYQPTENTRAWEKPTVMAKRANAVYAVTGDFYRHRTIGTVVYQGEIYRSDPVSLDTCMFDSSGNMNFVYRKELNKEELAAYVADNDIRFSVSFGPVLIEDGEKVKYGRYPIGENNGQFDRCAMGQLDELHYLVLTANFTRKYKTPAVLRQATDYLYDKGCVQGYALDGGRTGAQVFNGEVVHHINYGGERKSSDIICFASALPDN